MEAKNKQLNARVRMFCSGQIITSDAFLNGMKLMEKLARADVVAIDKLFNGLSHHEIEELKYKRMTKSSKQMIQIRRKYHPVSHLNMHQYLAEMMDIIHS